MFVADPVQRRHLLGGEAAGLGEDRIDQVLGKIAKQSSIERGF